MDIDKLLNNIIINYNLKKEYMLLKKMGIYRQVDIEWNKKFTNMNIHGGIKDPERNYFSEVFLTKKYIDEENIENKKLGLKALFYLALEMRNFLEAEKIYNELLSYQEFYYTNIWEKIQNLLNIIKIEILKRNKKDILCYWLDALDYGEEKDMDYLRAQMAGGVYFSNAFTVSPYTKPTAKSMFLKKRIIDDQSYKIKKIDAQDSFVIRILEKNGYACKIISGCLNKIFPTKLLSNNSHEFYNPCSMIFWDMIGLMLNIEESIFVLNHCIAESHYPYFHWNMSKCDYKNDDINYYFGKKELDQQLEFYDSLIPSSVTRIFMSDHGQWLFKSRYHVLLSVKNEMNTAYICDTLFSLEDFESLIVAILENKRVDECIPDKEYLPLQDIDWYSKDRIKVAIDGKSGIDLHFFGYKGIVTNNHIYMRFSMGKEWLVDRNKQISEPTLLDTEEDICDVSLLTSFRELVGKFPEWLWIDDKFKYSKFSYQLCDSWKKNQKVRIQIIEDELRKYPEKGIAIRTGGIHSWCLYNMLSKEIKNKIFCFIDSNEKCRCRYTGLPIMSIDDAEKHGIEGIVLSSFLHLHQLRVESKSYPPNLSIIDLYSLLEKNGIYPKYNFFAGSEIPECDLEAIRVSFNKLVSINEQI